MMTAPTIQEVRKGRPVDRRFWFVQAMGGLLPKESAALRDSQRIVPKDYQPSWAWALSRLRDDPDLWLVIPLRSRTDRARLLESNSVRSILWRTFYRFQQTHALTSERVDDKLWLRAFPRP